MPLRAKRRRVRAAFVLGVLLLVAAIGYGVSWVSYLPQFNISSVRVVGARGMSEELISRTIDIVLDDGAYRVLSRRNVLLYPRKEIEQKIVDSFPPVKSAHISRDSLFATDMLITIEEREPFARWCTGMYQGECHLMDAGGYIYAPMGWAGAGTSSTQYIFAGGLPAREDNATSTHPIGESFVQAHLPGLLSLLKFLGQAGFTPLGADVDKQDILVPLKEGFILKASFGADAGTLVKNLQLILSSDVLKEKREALEYVDLRFGNRVYYKLKGQEQQSTQ